MAAVATLENSKAASESPAGLDMAAPQPTAADGTTPCSRQKNKEDVGWRRIVRNFTPS